MKLTPKISALFPSLVGRMYGYRLNGEVNVEMSNYLWSYLAQQIGSVSQEAAYRSHIYIAIAQQCREPKSVLLGIAYATYYINALPDLLYPKLFKWLLPKKTWNLVCNNQYNLFEYINNLFSCIRNKKKIFTHLNHIHKHNVEYFPIHKQSFLTGIIVTEKLNATFNRISWNSTQSHKKQKIIAFANLHTKPGNIIKGAKQSQHAASKWDHVFLFLFFVRHPNMKTKLSTIEHKIAQISLI